MQPEEPGPLGLPPGVRACLFDLDGVLTKTAAVHNAAWTETFDSYLRDRAGRTGEPFRPFDPEDDYNTYVDGKPRADGVRDFLASRGIELDEGSADDPPDAETVNGLGNRKNVVLQRRIRDDGVEVYEGSVRYARAVRDAGLAAAVVSSSANTRDVLDVTGIADLFDAVVDGNVLRELGLRGKPAPDGFLEGARLLDAKPHGGSGLRGRRLGRRGRPGRLVRRRDRGRPGRARAGAARARRRPGGRGPRGAAGMTTGGVFTIEPWCLRETRLELDDLDRTESLFALSNGHVGLRGNLEEGEPSGLPGTYLNGVYERRPLPYAEAGYGFPEDGQTAINVTDGKIMRLLVDDEPFDVRYGELHAHERMIDFREGVLRREADWTSPAGQRVRVRSWRLVSLTQRAVVALCLEVEPVGDESRVVVQSELVADEDLPIREGDPRVAAALKSPLVHEAGHAKGTAATLVHRTRVSELRVAAAMDHETALRAGRQRGQRAQRQLVPGHLLHQAAARSDAARGQVRDLRLVAAAHGPGAARPGRGRHGGGAGHRVGGAARRAARLPARVLGAVRRRGRR